MLQNLPAEMRALPQWVVAGPEKLPLDPKTGRAADVTNPATWGTFEEAKAAANGSRHVGFVLTDAAGFTIIDLDNKADHPATPDQLSRHMKIMEAFDSYTETSASGRGTHIIVRGTVPAGLHRDNVEVYSSGRYMICTGNVIHHVGPAERQALLDALTREMTPAPSVDLDEQDPVQDDLGVLEMAMGAVNADKFNALCQGDWQAMGYPSQSEADFALLSMFAFYTRSNEQCRRLFRMTNLGKRDKAIQNNKYLDRALEKIRALQPEPVDLAGLLAGAQAVQASQVVLPPTPEELVLATPTPDPQGTPFPTGIIGEVAQYILDTSIRPVPDVALTAAIALVAGVVGRSYNVSGTGLNQYMILIARTGAGKEGAATGIGNLVAAVRPSVPMIDQFTGPGAFASGQSLIKVLDERPCFCSVLGEFGMTLQQLCSDNASSAQIMLRKVLLDLYAKSGWTQTLYSSVYADTEKNTKVIQAPCVTILGESTPETFFEGLDNSHIAEGLIPRFTVVQYQGHRPPRNRNANCAPSAELVRRFSELVVVALTTSNNRTVAPVQADPEAQRLLDEYDRSCDARINNASDEVTLQLWNRAHLKVLKMAALLAVGDNPHAPVIHRGHAEWALAFIERDVKGMVARFTTGNVGTGDSKQLHDLKKYLREFPQADTSAKYNVPATMVAARVVPYRYMSSRTANVASFRKDRRGHTVALKNAIECLVLSGILIEIPKMQTQKQFGYAGQCWFYAPE